MKRIISRLRDREDSEHIQMVVKFILGCIYLCYFLSAALTDEEVKSVVLIAILFLIIQVLFLCWIIINPAIHRVRRGISMISDVYITTMILLPLGEVGAPMFSGYLFLSFGYGFRYGNRYLFASALLSVISFAIVINYNPFWNSHSYLSYGNLVSIGILTIYVSTLISQLHRAVNEAKEANRAKSQFLSNMSHEIRTPLNGVIGTSSLLAKTKLDKKQREFIATIDGSSQNLLGVINDILDISKIEAGKINVVEKDFDLHEFVNSTVGLFVSQTKTKKIDLNVYIDANTPYLLRGDEQLLRQVLTNLISNAIKFTHQGRVDVCVSALNQERTKTTVLFEVIDTGIGIDEKAQANIFDKFTQADDSINRQFGGTGLGTAIAKQLIEAMGGAIHFSSEKNKGSTFWFEIELARQALKKEEFDLSSTLQDLFVYVLAPIDEKHQALSERISDWSPVNYINTQKKLLAAIKSNSIYTASTSVVMVSMNSIYNDPEAYINKVKENGLLDICRIILIHDDDLDNDKRLMLLQQGYAAIVKSSDHGAILFRALHALLAGVEFNNDRLNHVHDINEASNRNSLSILVADDNQTNRDVIRNILEYGHHQVTLVENGQLALEMTERHDYDLIIMDMHMPVMGGIEAAERYQNMYPETEQVPFIILTANATTEAEKECSDTGVTLYLTKPIIPDYLLEKINELVVGEKSKTQQMNAPIDFAKYNSQKNLSLLDIDTLDQLSSMAKREAFMEQLIQGYIHDTTQKIEALPGLLEENKIEELSNLIHAIDGSSRSLGATHLALLANKANKKIKSENRTSVVASIEELKIVFNDTRTALLQYVDKAQLINA